MHLIWPTSLRSPDEGYALGWRTSRAVYVLTVVNDWQQAQNIIRQCRDAVGLAKTPKTPVVGVIAVVCRPEEAKGEFREEVDLPRLTLSTGRLVHCEPSMEVILVDPPDPDRLRYLTASGPTAEADDQSAAVDCLGVQDSYGPRAGFSKSESEVEEMLRLINTMKAARRRIERALVPKTKSAPPSISRFASSTMPVINVLALAFVPITILSGLLVRLANQRQSVGWSPVSTLSASATLQQIALRSTQLLEAPRRFHNTLRAQEVPIETRSKRYMRFWNTVWLILNDLILGYCAYQVLTHNDRFFAHHLPAFVERYLASDIISALTWLNDWPVGLKLNTPLSQFYCSTLTILLQSWKEIMLPMTQSLALLLTTALAITSLAGLTLFLAALEDVVSLFTLHLRLCNTMTRGICRWQLASLGGLWNLFRGKRWNVLRQRTDSYQYDVDQLFLGTLLFTVSAFLLPTVLTYASLFLLLAVVVSALTYCLRTLRTALNSFPLFEVLLRVKEPSRLPAGIYFELRPSAKAGIPTLVLKNSPRPMTSILGGIFRHQQAKADQ
ncbi:N-acetylglucosaminyl transferase component-domain-containing protein [Dioszegia hungarica]|uniref:N-acetylglucosaminyl transferase component-domain-containing protein n=1 Tax=Dioszegia hungarica TaxID=4972 RepID=A0AA38H288_9TREE|nr:N-acetylglucosaminyl transferase component-domain-containing protein [Dioszegia hungarica]KAI9632798.1 N-acetylglucosaminyl transferase component-domain-containing protein [Dioszegia hungarica]